jgi:glycerol-3-phosphate dehydrogenase
VWFKSVAASGAGDIDEASIRHLACSYGTELPELIRLAESSGSERSQSLNEAGDLLQARVCYAVRFEMAQRLLDVIYRRTDLGVSGQVTPKLVDACASWMAAELNWDRERLESEIETVSTSPVFAAA